MKITQTLMRLLTALAVVGFLSVSSVSAQTALTTTTLTTAITDTSSTSLVLASVTGVSAPGTGSTLTYLYFDSEAVQVRTVNTTSLVVTVTRGALGTRAATHAANSLVFVVPATAAPTVLTTVDFGGSCTPGNYAYLPIINTRSGNIWNCVATTVGSAWQGWNPIPLMETKPRTVIGGVQTAAGLVSPNTAIGLNYTILPTDYIVVLATSGTTPGSVLTAIKSFTLPSHVGLAGKQLIIKDESGAISATTKIILIGTIDGTNSATATVVQLATPWGAVGLEAGSGGWFTIWCHGGNGSTTCR